jgi:hypothetical protein
MGTGSFPVVESPPLVSRSKNRVELYLYSTYWPSWPVKKGETYHNNNSVTLHQAVLVLWAASTDLCALNPQFINDAP